MPDKILIIIPTYNEKENMALLIGEIFTFLPEADILVVDDNSPDGTAQDVELLGEKEPRLKLLKRQCKLGLGSAYVAGFRYALKNNYEFIFQMDADFSHHPKYLPGFLESARDYDLVLGSRYIRGGGVKGWSFYRKTLSYAGNLYSRFFTRLNVRDLTGGYKCYRRKVISAIMGKPFFSDGYTFQIEATFRAAKSGFRIKELPILFENRYRGKSKISKKIIFEALFRVPFLPGKFLEKNT